jgi:hypothetical protein
MCKTANPVDVHGGTTVNCQWLRCEYVGVADNRRVVWKIPMRLVMKVGDTKQMGSMTVYEKTSQSSEARSLLASRGELSGTVQHLQGPFHGHLHNT